MLLYTIFISLIYFPMENVANINIYSLYKYFLKENICLYNIYLQYRLPFNIFQWKIIRLRIIVLYYYVINYAAVG